MSDTAQGVNHEQSSLELIDWFAIAGTLWQSKKIILGVSAVIVSAAVLFAITSPNIYKAELKLVANNSFSSSSSSLASQYGGLASLAGIDLEGGGGTDVSVGLEILRSRVFLTEFVSSRELLIPLMAADSWDPISRTLALDSSKYDVDAEEWVRDVSPPRTPKPSPLESYDEFLRILSVSEDEETGVVTLSIEHQSPVLAAEWLTELVSQLNAEIQAQEVKRAEDAIQYLRGQVENTSLSGLRDVFYALIEEHIQTMMLAQMSEEFLLRTIDPAFEPEEKIRPNRGLIVLAGLILGFFAGSAIALVVARSRKGAATHSPA